MTSARCVALAAVGLAAAGCSRDRLTLAVHSGVEGGALKHIAALFAATEAVEVEIVELPYDELAAAEAQAVKKGFYRYDVIMIDDPWLPALTESSTGDRGLLTITKPEDLDDFVPTC
jgi:ABC-type glycerol-3-phosphate transport system substrate-binding protein